MSFQYQNRFHHAPESIWKSASLNPAGFRLRRPPQLLHNTPGANSIEVLTKISDHFRTAMMFLKLERIERDWLSECLDLKLD
jgi:hypothetical protein